MSVLTHVEKQKLYEKLIGTIPELIVKGAANPYTSLNGNMFTLLSSKGPLGIRLPKEEREKFLTKFETTLVEVYGTVMPEYVSVPDTLLQDTKVLKKYLAISYEYVKTLRPKATKKSKK